MDNLRLILILIGLVILALIWFLHQPRGRRRPGATRREGQRIEPDLNAQQAREPSSDDDDQIIGEPTQTALPSMPEEAVSDNGRREPVWTEPSPEQEVWPQDRKRTAADDSVVADSDQPANDSLQEEAPQVVTLYIRAREGRRISGLSLLDAAIKAGLEFGDMNIFHRLQEGADEAVFSMANLTPPGTFDPAAWNLFETPGVTLFLKLPNPLTALDAWAAMLATGQRLAELLDAELLDDAQCQVTRQRVAQVREDMREYDRKNEWTD
ncbi:MAG: cell division protein ZipA [Pseudomonadota bacterium]